MTIATQPSAAVSPRMERAIADRWTEWETPMMWHLRTGTYPKDLVPYMRSHREWMIHLLARGIPLRAIRRLVLDDPREPRLVLIARAELYNDKQSRRKRHVAD